MYNENDYNYWLANIPGIGNITINRLLERFHTAQAIYMANDAGLLETEEMNLRLLTRINEAREAGINTDISRSPLPSGIKCVYKTSGEYPEKLKRLYDAPFCLYHKGRFPDEHIPSVAIVGARGCTEYGKNQAYNLAYTLAREGVQVISGLAAGIDSAAHKGTLDAGGYTAALMGCGADICYPRINYNIYEEISRVGGIISEFPPGTKPSPGYFPMRNRIISALADAVVVIEARERSGSLITADQALEQGRDVYALPGRVTDPLSKGCLWLIQQGAYVLTGTEDILNSPEISKKLKKAPLPGQNVPTREPRNNYDQNASDNIREITHSGKNSGPDLCLSSKGRAILSILGDEPASLDRIAKACGLSHDDAISQVLSLSLSGHIHEVSTGLYVRGHA